MAANSDVFSSKSFNPLQHTFFVPVYFDEIRYTRVFGVADHESEVSFAKFKMAEPRWRSKILKVNQIRSNLVHRGFWGR